MQSDGTPVDLAKVCSSIGRGRTYSTREFNDLISGSNEKDGSSYCTQTDPKYVDPHESYALMTIDEIINGSVSFKKKKIF